MTEYKELTGEKKEKFKKWLKQFQKENDRSPTIEEVYDEATKELEAQIEKMKCLLNEIYSEFGFSELVKIRNNLPIEIQEVIKEIKEK